MGLKRDFREYIKSAATDMLNYANEPLYYPVEEISHIEVKWDEGGIEQDPSGYSSDWVRPPQIRIRVKVTAEPLDYAKLTTTKELDLDTSEALTALMQALVLDEVTV